MAARNASATAWKTVKRKSEASDIVPAQAFKSKPLVPKITPTTVLAWIDAENKSKVAGSALGGGALSPAATPKKLEVHFCAGEPTRQRELLGILQGLVDECDVYRTGPTAAQVAQIDLRDTETSLHVL